MSVITLTIYLALSEVYSTHNMHKPDICYLLYANAIGDLEIIRQQLHKTAEINICNNLVFGEMNWYYNGICCI